MKTKKLQIVSVLLLAALVGCGTNKESDKVSNATEAGSNTSETAKDTTETPADTNPTSVTLTAKRNYLYVNETIDLVPVFEPAGTSIDYRLTSSDPDLISAVGSQIKGVSATGKDEEVTITITTDNNLTASCKFVVYNVLDKAISLLEASNKVALTSATSGSLDINSYEKDQEDYSESYSYNIYKDRSEVIDEVTDGTKDTVTTIFNRAVIGDHYVESKRTRTGASGTFSDVRGYLENRAIVDTVTEKNYQYTMEEAKQRVADVQIGDYSATNPIHGLEGFAMNYFIYDVSSFASSYAKESLRLEESLSDISNIYTLSYDYTRGEGSSQVRVEEELTLEFDSTGLLIDLKDALHHYEGEDLEEVASYEIAGVQNGGEREDAPSDAFDFSQYFFKDYNVYFHQSMFNYESTCETEYNVGDTAYLLTYDGYIGGSPSTATTYIDPIRVTAVSDPDAVEIIYGNRIKFLKLVENLEVTVTSAMSKIQKKVTLHCLPPKTTTIQIGEFSNPGSSFSSYIGASSSHYLPSSWIMGTDKEVWVVGGKYQETPSITVTSSNPSVATVTMVEDSENKFVFHPVSTGKTTIKIVDSTLGEAKAITKDVTIFDNSDVGIANLFRESTWSAYNKSMYSNFAFTGEKDTTKGDFRGHYDVTDTSYIDIWGSWEVKDGVIQATTYSGAFGEIVYGSPEFVITDIDYSNYQKFGPTWVTVKGSSQYAGDIGEGYGASVILE